MPVHRQLKPRRGSEPFQLQQARTNDAQRIQPLIFKIESIRRLSHIILIRRRGERRVTSANFGAGAPLARAQSLSARVRANEARGEDACFTARTRAPASSIH